MADNPSIHDAGKNQDQRNEDYEFIDCLAETLSGKEEGSGQIKCIDHSYVCIEAQNCDKIIFIGGKIIIKNINAACKTKENKKPHPCGKIETKITQTYLNGTPWVSQKA